MNLAGCDQRRDRESDCLHRYVGQPGEAAIVDLLLPGGCINRNDPHRNRVVEAGRSGLVEREMAILADSEARETEWCGFEEAGVAAALNDRINRSIDHVHATRRNSVE